MITPAILCGGTGSRLWPLSRAARPKQLLALLGDKTMLQMTVARTGDRTRFGPPIVVAGAQHAAEIEHQIEEIGITPAALVLEPCARSTAPAIALAALLAAPDVQMLVMPSDHLIRDEAAFLRALDVATPAASEGALVTFGVTPERPETGYGYIRRGAALAPGVHRADAFIEKPKLSAAAALAGDGEHLWNAGIFLFRPDAFLHALEQHAPAVIEAARRALAAGSRTGLRVAPEAEAFASAPSISIDYAVMEKAEHVAVVPVDMGWSDVGCWDAIFELGEKDEGGNLSSGPVVAIDSRRCLIRSEGPNVVTLGVSDLLVLATGDAVLIVPRGQSQRVKEAVDALQARASGAFGQTGPPAY
ncbi:MAG: mannose-1-phosphate guanylyltransferase/mannose-6-phosphate isomerase [Pseudomonadota bacterium]|nr:mannose-1-phosphate guanylyltransferase/mannose-6-phosphate isomerase [Pseudomonadota bacterium]